MEPLQPNNSPFASSINNDPVLSPLMQIQGDVLNFSKVREDVNISSSDGAIIHTPMGSVNELMRLRGEFPFIPAMSFGFMDTLFLPTADQPGELVIPDAAALMLVSSNNPVYISNTGNAKRPSAANNIDIANDDSKRPRSFLNVSGMFWYVGNVQSVSFVSGSANTEISVMYWQPQEFPTYGN